MSGDWHDPKAAAATSSHDLILLIAQARVRQGLSQGEVARRMGVTKPMVCVLEGRRRVPLLSTVLRYADAVGVRLVVEE